MSGLSESGNVLRQLFAKAAIAARALAHSHASECGLRGSRNARKEWQQPISTREQSITSVSLSPNEGCSARASGLYSYR